MKLRDFLYCHINAYRVTVAIGFIIATVLVLAVPVRMIGASPWAYYYGIQNYAQGQFTVNDELHSQQQEEAREKGGTLQQYFEIDDNTWALEKAPGYVFYIIPFELMGIPRWGNVLLALGMTVITYILLRRLRDEKAACIGSLLILFTPVSLIMFNLAYMDTYASLAFLAMGGGLYIIYILDRDKYNILTAGLILFFAFLLIAWSVVTRYTNFPIAAVIAIHFAVISLISLKRRIWKKSGIEIISVAAGIVLPLAFLLLYNYYIFGSPLDYGYNYTRFSIKFAFEYLGQVNESGQSLPLQIIIDNLRAAPSALLLGFPLLIIGIPGIVTVLYFKFRKSDQSGIWSSINRELPWDILLVLIGWFVSVFFLYMTYEFTAEYLGESSSFIRFARFYLPGLFPVAIICALIVSRFPFKLWIPVIAAIVISGSIIYTQYIFDSGSSHNRNTQEHHQQDRTIPGRKFDTGVNKSGYFVNYPADVWKYYREELL